MHFRIAALAMAAIGVHAAPKPVPQGVTSAIAPTSKAPSGCLPTYSGTFGIAIMPLATASPSPTSPAPSVVTARPDGQPIPATSKATVVSSLPDGQPQLRTVISSLPDGQPQVRTTMTMKPVTQIGDGQIQAPPTTTVKPVTQIADGQIQATTPKVSTTSAAAARPDGQVTAKPASTTSAAAARSDGQVTASTSAAAAKKDGQPTVPSTLTTATQTGSSSSPSASVVACKGPGTLALTLSNGILLDSQGRTGYIASNYQFQFDKPAQAGAIYTSGFSTCGNGTLALGGSTTFYSCASGDFSNLYDRKWAAHCTPVQIGLTSLIDCPK